MLRERLREASLKKLITRFSSHKQHKRTTQSCRPAVSAVTEWEGTSKDVELSDCHVTNNSRGWKQLARVHSTGCKPWTSKLLTTNLRPAVLTKRALMAIQQLLRGAVEGPECTCATSFARAIARGNRFHAISPVTCASQNEFDVGTDGMLWCRYCNYVSKRGFNMRRHYQRNHLGLLAPRLVSRAELVLLPPVSEGSHRGWILP
ncbi:uncharacterized protein LOC115319380 isoform X3 [Ixodes scapularis]|uniref:uncharacterized protein LOC115319380 isoform X3 n=1 Tax=Ixodes scapularis TaxID=6945 RepID=UPI001C37EA5D|nr:uncharacterized protein LOC115319380 isoform X3 [Ixodes scapularis]